MPSVGPLASFVFQKTTTDDSKKNVPPFASASRGIRTLPPCHLLFWFDNFLTTQRLSQWTAAVPLSPECHIFDVGYDSEWRAAFLCEGLVQNAHKILKNRFV